MKLRYVILLFNGFITFSGAAALDYHAAGGAFLLSEKGPVSSCTALGLDISLEAVIPIEPAELSAGFDFFSGAFIGESLGFGYLIVDRKAIIDTMGADYSYSSWELVLKPCRFVVPLAKNLDLVLSALELRYGSILPTPILPWNKAGSFSMCAELFRAAVSIKL